MGSGIAQVNNKIKFLCDCSQSIKLCSKVAAQSGFNVTLVDLDASLIENAMLSMRRNMERVGKKVFSDDSKIKTFVEGSIGRIQGSTNVQDSVKHTDIVIEAIVEKLETKQKFFSSIDSVSRKFIHAVHPFGILPIVDRSTSNNFCQQHFLTFYCRHRKVYQASR